MDRKGEGKGTDRWGEERIEMGKERIGWGRRG